MRDRPDWMTTGDLLILQSLDSSPILRYLSPTTVADNIDISREHAQRRLRELESYGLVDRPEEGKYIITQLGRSYLAGDLDANEVGGEDS